MNKLLMLVLVSVLLMIPASASTWIYSNPGFEITDLPGIGLRSRVCGEVPYKITNDTLRFWVDINVTEYTLITTDVLVRYIDSDGAIIYYTLSHTQNYASGLSPVHLILPEVKFQVGTYDVVGGSSGIGTCQLVVQPKVVIPSRKIISAKYGDGWQKQCYSDGTCAYSNHLTYLRWDNQWIPVEWLNISNGNWSYKVEDAVDEMNFTADGKSIYIPKPNTKFDLSLFKISPSLTYTKTQLQNNMVSVNTTVAYLVFPYSLSQIKDYADKNNIKIGRWMFRAGQEHIDVYDDVKVNRTFMNETGQNETHLAITTLDKSAYQFGIVNDEIRIYFLKAEANKMSGNITFEMNSWTVGEGGNAWTGNSTKDNTTLNRDTNRIMLRQDNI